MKRRDLLRWLGAGGAAAAVLQHHKHARAFGDPPPAVQPFPPEAYRPKRILECFLYGGLTTWETFYAVKEFGTPEDPDPALRNTQFYAFHNPQNDRLIKALELCGEVPSELLTPFATDADGHTVHLGPFVSPLLGRPDILDRMRVVVTKHTLQPHEAAIPLALCGKTLGVPAAASLGAHIQRFEAEHGLSSRSTPYAYTLTSTLASNLFSTDNTQAATATGLHPGSARPLLIKVNHAERLASLLGREGFSKNLDRAYHDLLLAEYEAQYEARLRWPGRQGHVRAPSFDGLAASNRSVAGAEDLAKILDSQLFVGFISSVCGDQKVNVPGMSLRLAAHLLTHPTDPASHVCFIDTGLVLADTGGGYDSHIENCHTQSRNIRNTLAELVSRIRAPGEQDPGKIDLDETMVVLNMEFGRSPGLQGQAGRNHWPYGYVTVYLGGMIKKGQGGVAGAIGPDGHATAATTPAEHRIASLLSVGIWPFSAEAFGAGDVPGAKTEPEAAALSLQRVMGYTP